MPTNSDVLLPTQTALYGLLSVELAPSIGVHDEVPEGAAFPYVVIGEATVGPDNTHDRFGHVATVTLHVWSTAHGYSETLGIVGQLLELLDHQTLTIAGVDAVVVRWQQTVTMRDPDRDLRHGVVRFSISTEQPPE